MGQLVEFPLQDGGSVLIEVAEPAATGPVTRGLGGGDITDTPNEVHVEFGLDLHAEAGAFIASASTTANFKVAVTWRHT